MKTTRRILPLFFILSISEHVLLWRYRLCWNGEIYVNFYVYCVCIQYVVYILCHVLCVLCFACVCGCLKKLCLTAIKFYPACCGAFFGQSAELNAELNAE